MESSGLTCRRLRFDRLWRCLAACALVLTLAWSGTTTADTVEQTEPARRARPYPDPRA